MAGRRDTRSVVLPPARSALAAPFIVVGRELREVASRPLPFVGGVLGSLIGCAALTAALLSMPTPAAAEPEEVFTVEFIPTALVSAGELEAQEPVDEPSEEPASADEAEAEAEPEASEDPSASVSESASTPASETEPEVAPETPRRPKPKPDPKPEPEVDPKPGPAPGVDDPRDLWTDDGAWTDLVRDGDPWATAVLRALQGMQVPAWAGKISADNPYRFRLKICKDGRVDKVLRKGSTGDADLDATLAHELSRLDLPAIPAKQAAGMAGSCAVLDYTFAWKASGVG